MHVLIRVDGSAAVGLGHVTRCLAFAEGLRGLGVRSTFVTLAPASVTGKITASGFRAVRMRRRLGWRNDARFFLRQADTVGANAAIVDSYDLGLSYQRALRASGIHLCVIEDVPRGPIAADLVIDQRIDAQSSDYPAGKSTRFLLGPRYSLLRPSFAKLRSKRCRRGDPPRVLVIMGGSDPRDATLATLAALDGLPSDFALDVVAGAAFARLPRLAAAVGAARHSARLHHDPRDVAAVMARAALAVSAAGGTCWELACLGVPAVILVAADNQQPNAAGLARSGCALTLGDISPFPARRVRNSVSILLADRRRLRRMSSAGKRLVDGLGARRAARALLRLMK